MCEEKTTTKTRDQHVTMGTNITLNIFKGKNSLSTRISLLQLE